MHILEKINNAISLFENSTSKEANINLNYGELIALRKLVLADIYCMESSGNSFRKKMDLSKPKVTLEDKLIEAENKGYAVIHVESECFFFFLPNSIKFKKDMVIKNSSGNEFVVTGLCTNGRVIAERLK